MKTVNMMKYISILGIVLAVIGAFLTTGGEGTSLIIALVSSLIVIAASIKK